MAEEPTAPGRATLWRPLATAVLFGVLPFTTFLSDNASEAEVDAGFLAYPVGLVALGLLVVAVAARRGRPAAERAAVMFATASFVFFKFVLVEKVVERLPGVSGYAPTLALWLLGFAAVCALAWRFARHSVAWAFCLVFGALLVVASTWNYVSATSGSTPRVQGRVPAQVTQAPEQTPSVWFLMLDGYSRADVLRDEVGVDNKPFLTDLEERGFTVAEDAAAAYPRTLGSLASTLAMDYVIPPGELTDLGPLFGAIRGRNATVRSFRRLGYDVAMATDYAEFSCTDDQDVCVYPPDGPGIGGRDVVLDGTPLGYPLNELAAGSDSSRRLLAPDDAVGRVLAERGERPLFAYVHLIVPHPPYRYDEDCGDRQIEDLSQHDWIASERDLYAVAVRCLNGDLLRAVDRILETDPDAIIAMAGDHGSAFGVQLSQDANDWPQEDVRERYGILSALRVPGSCPGSKQAPAAPVNTFRVVLGCLTGRAIPMLPPRHFSMVYGTSTRVRELTADLRAR